MQANATYTDSNAPTSLVGFSAALPQLSKYSYNVAGIYEKYGISARVAYNYRSSFLSSILAGGFTPVGGGATQSFIFPVMTKGYGWLDASLSYDVTPHITLTVDGQNLLRTQIQQYYQVVTRPGQYTIDDRQFMARGARALLIRGMRGLGGSPSGPRFLKRAIRLGRARCRATGRLRA